MNVERHRQGASSTFTTILPRARSRRRKRSRTFYDEYFAVLDLPAEFYLETVRLGVPGARGCRQGRTRPAAARRVEPSAIHRTMLLTVEGERDDICSIGLTSAAHELCWGLRPHSNATICRLASAITACSPGGAGRRRCIRR